MVGLAGRTALTAATVPAAPGTTLEAAPEPPELAWLVALTCCREAGAPVVVEMTALVPAAGALGVTAPELLLVAAAAPLTSCRETGLPAVVLLAAVLPVTW